MSATLILVYFANCISSLQFFFQRKENPLASIYFYSIKAFAVSICFMFHCFYCSLIDGHLHFFSFAYLYTSFFNHGRLKIFSPIAILAFAVLVPVNWTNDTLKFSTLQHSNIDKLSISNIPVGSKRLALDDFIIILKCIYSSI